MVKLASGPASGGGGGGRDAASTRGGGSGAQGTMQSLAQAKMETVDAKIKAAEADLEFLRARRKDLEAQARSEVEAASNRRRRKEWVPL